MPGPEDHPCVMGARAAEVAIARAGIDPLEIDAVISISEEYKERPLMVSGIKIQQLVGARNAWAVDVAQRCCTTIAGLTLARALMATDPRVRTVLLAGGYRNGDLIDYTNPRVSFMYALAPGGGALLLRRDHDRNELLGGALVSDGDFADDVSCAGGGTVAPLTAETAGTAAAMLDVHDVDGMKARLAERSHANFMRVIARGRAARRSRGGGHRLPRAAAHEALGARRGARRARPVAASSRTTSSSTATSVSSIPSCRSSSATPPAACATARSWSWRAPASATRGARTRCAGARPPPEPRRNAAAELPLLVV